MPDDNNIRTKYYDPENPRCDQEQLKFLKECIAEGPEGIEKWNERRKKNKATEVWLQKATFSKVNLQKANLVKAHLEGANLAKAQMESVLLEEAHMVGANLGQAKLEEADLWEAHLECAKLREAHLEGAILRGTHLEGAALDEAHLEGAELIEAHMEGTILHGNHLQGVDFSRAIVDGKTLIWGCGVDSKTKAEAVGLDSMRIYPSTKQLLEYNIRRMNWEAWYEYKDWDAINPEDKRKRSYRILRQPVKWFWAISDYGRSMGRIIFTFLGSALLFASIYYIWGRLASPGIVENLFVDRNGVDIQWWLVPLRTLYFSIVTQTTLGFGDMYANAHSIWGHILLSFQVILGYVLLGALVTRFAVLFTAGGPAGKFAEKSQ